MLGLQQLAIVNRGSPGPATAVPARALSLYLPTPFILCLGVCAAL